MPCCTFVDVAICTGVNEELTPMRLSNIAFDFLRTDLDTGLTFMNVAESTRDADAQQRNHENARRAYDAVVRLMQSLSLDDTQNKEVAEKLALLKSRLQNVGQKF